MHWRGEIRGKKIEFISPSIFVLDRHLDANKTDIILNYKPSLPKIISDTNSNDEKSCFSLENVLRE